MSQVMQVLIFKTFLKLIFFQRETQQDFFMGQQCFPFGTRQKIRKNYSSLQIILLFFGTCHFKKLFQVQFHLIQAQWTDLQKRGKKGATEPSCLNCTSNQSRILLLRIVSNIRTLFSNKAVKNSIPTSKNEAYLNQKLRIRFTPKKNLKPTHFSL